MRGRYLTIVSALLFSLASQAGHAAQYITLDISFDEGTALVGINSSNKGVGYSYDDRGQFYGFTFTPTGGYTGDVIVSVSTIPVGIDDAGDVAGYYFDAGTETRLRTASSCPRAAPSRNSTYPGGPLELTSRR